MDIKLKVIKDFRNYKIGDIIDVQIEGYYFEGRWICDSIYDDGFLICDMGTEFFKKHLEKV